MPLGRTSNVLDGRPVQKDAAGGIQIDWWSAGMSHNGKMQRARKSGAVSKALVVRPPWIEKILRRQKTWELRSRRTKARGPIGLIESRSGMVVGICDVVDVVGRFHWPPYAGPFGITRYRRRNCLSRGQIRRHMRGFCAMRGDYIHLYRMSIPQGP